MSCPVHDKMTDNGTHIRDVADNEVRALRIAGQCVVMEPLLVAGVNFMEAVVVWRHLSPNIGFNAYGFGNVEVGVGSSHHVTCISGRGLPVLTQ